jgi:hypothetical protein
MTLKRIPEPPVAEIFMLFFTYGGLLMVVYTSFFWEWSGAASLGAFYLILGAPIIMTIIAYKQFRKRNISKYHKWTSNLAMGYFLISPLVFLILYHFSD